MRRIAATPTQASPPPFAHACIFVYAATNAIHLHSSGKSKNAYYGHFFRSLFLLSPFVFCVCCVSHSFAIFLLNFLRAAYRNDINAPHSVRHSAGPADVDLFNLCYTSCSLPFVSISPLCAGSHIIIFPTVPELKVRTSYG